MEENSEIIEYHCTNCGTRVSREDTRCPACGAELEGFEDEDHDTTVMLKEFSTEVDADLAQTLLQSKGIECYLTGGDSDGTLYSPIPFKLVVLKKDLNHALEILESNSM